VEIPLTKHHMRLRWPNTAVNLEILSVEDVTILHKNTLYMDHLMKITNDPATLWQFHRCEIHSWNMATITHQQSRVVNK
jgi:hypothetical protein